MLRILFVALAFLALPVSSYAQSNERSDAILKAWQNWVSSNRVGKSTIAITYRGKLVMAEGHRMDASKPAPLASLSKAITAVCVNSLFAAGRVFPETKLAEIFGANLEALKINAPKSSEITLSQLISQSSGLARDTTQRDMGRWVGNRKVRHLDVAKKALKRGPSKSGRYFYNNENYAILGAVIEKVTGTKYADYCSRAVLRPAGIKTARLSRKWGAFAAWGGWEMSASDYAKFLKYAFGRNSAIGKKPTAYPRVFLGRGAYYGMGTLFRASGNSFNFWHAGRHCFSQGGAGAFYASWNGDWAVVVTYNKCLKDNAVGNLDTALANAALR